ncbi:hypothetical protein [Maricaulis salignorans]|uniref:Uncharacterized protein n=1 Tax=Maricaulis salignorans TaxID=144026 RepID=A0A1G9T7H3_9PROT|nr:hypothetical protein [Maricaulis salignorans]SDM43598.1 hypothetical protein SAMN04488568_11160 [Maricaulis salignorans]
MQLKSINGKLTLGSAYKLFVVSWYIGWTSIFVIIGGIGLLAMLVSGQATINGEVVEGAGPVAAQLLPMLALFPIIIIFHAFVFSGLLLLGLIIYRIWRPVQITDYQPAVKNAVPTNTASQD